MVTLAKTEHVTIKPEIVENIGRKLVAQRGSSEAWDTAIDFLNYKSFLNVSLSVAVNSVMPTGILNTKYGMRAPHGIGPPRFTVAGAVPEGQAAQLNVIGEPDRNTPLGNDWIIADGGGLVIDNMQLKKVIFRNVYISYDGGPIHMQDVYFMNCVFQVRQQSNGERFAFAVLSPPPATTLVTPSESESAALFLQSTH